jgi:hypothetical protein
LGVCVGDERGYPGAIAQTAARRINVKYAKVR